MKFMLQRKTPGQDSSDPHIVGGKAPDCAFIPASDPGELLKQNLAQVHACTYLKHVDCHSGGFQVQQTPRLRLNDANHEFNEIAQVLQACIDGASGVPPLCVAFDCHGSFGKVHNFFLGILPLSDYAQNPLFNKFVPAEQRVKALMFPQHHMCYVTQDLPVFGCLDPKHILKAVARSLRSPSRILKMLLWRQKMLGPSEFNGIHGNSMEFHPLKI